MAQNEGKLFEEDLKLSCKDIDITRFVDGAAGNYIGEQTAKEGLRFSPGNICDYVLFDGNLLLYVELKSTKGTSMSFGDMKEKLIDKKKKVKTGMFKHKQLIGLIEKEQRQMSNIKNIGGGLLLNFREKEATYYINAVKLNNFIMSTEKKSINPVDLENIGAVKMQQHKKVTRYRYNIKGLMERICGEKT